MTQFSRASEGSVLSSWDTLTVQCIDSERCRCGRLCAWGGGKIRGAIVLSLEYGGRNTSLNNPALWPSGQGLYSPRIGKRVSHIVCDAMPELSLFFPGASAAQPSRRHVGILPCQGPTDARLKRHALIVWSGSRFRRSGSTGVPAVPRGEPDRRCVEILL